MSDEKQGKSKKKKTLIWAMIIITITTGISLTILGYGIAGYWENDIIESELANGQLQEVRCERWLEVADSLIKKNDGNENITEWSESDRISILGIEELYQENCIPTDLEIMDDLEKCTEIYITIESLIDKMDERHLDTLSEEDQNAYNENYEEYFDSYCNRIKNQVEKTYDFIQFNKTRLQ